MRLIFGKSHFPSQSRQNQQNEGHKIKHDFRYFFAFCSNLDLSLCCIAAFFIQFSYLVMCVQNDVFFHIFFSFSSQSPKIRKSEPWEEENSWKSNCADSSSFLEKTKIESDKTPSRNIHLKRRWFWWFSSTLFYFHYCTSRVNRNKHVSEKW